MPTQYVLDDVVRNEDQDWSNDNGQFHVYTLKAQGLEQLVRVNRKPDSPVLQPGQQVWLETQGSNRDGTLKGRVQKPPDQQPQQTAFGSRLPSHDDATRRSIERQTSLRGACDIYHGTGHDPAEVAKAADILFTWVSQS